MEFKDNEKLIIDQIRRNNPESINELSNMVGLPWSTVQKTLDKLRQNNNIIYTSDFVKLNSEYASFAGVSVGSSKIVCKNRHNIGCSIFQCFSNKHFDLDNTATDMI